MYIYHLEKPFFLQISINRIFKPFSKCCEIFYCRLRLIFDDRFHNDRLFFLFLIPLPLMYVLFILFYKKEKIGCVNFIFIHLFFRYLPKFIWDVVGFVHSDRWLFSFLSENWRIWMLTSFKGSIKWQRLMFFVVDK